MDPVFSSSCRAVLGGEYPCEFDIEKRPGRVTWLKRRVGWGSVIGAAAFSPMSAASRPTATPRR